MNKKQNKRQKKEIPEDLNFLKSKRCSMKVTGFDDL